MVGVREALTKLIPQEKARLMYHSYDIVGDIALVKVPYELDDYEMQVGTAIHNVHPQVRRVFRIVGETKEIERNRKLRLIWPEPETSIRNSVASGANIGRTVYYEYGCRFIVDVEKVFFTPRLSYERRRVARQVRTGEVVAVMFGGVGTYAILITKICSKVEKIFTIDVNTVAHELAEQNVLINKCSGKVIPILGDAGVICKDQLKGLCSRVIMPLPEYASSFLEGAVTALKEQGECVLNFYAEISGKQIENEADKAINETKSKILDYGARACRTDSWRIVREVSARRYHVAIDLKVSK